MPEKACTPWVNQEHERIKLHRCQGRSNPGVNVIGGSTGVSETLKAARQEHSQPPGGRIISRRDSPFLPSVLNLCEDISRPPKNKNKTKKKARAEPNKNKIKKQDTATDEGQHRVTRHLLAMALQGKPAAGEGRDRP